MITCPDCGQTAPDEARFCDQCGRGLQDLPPPVVALEPLEVGRELQGRFKITEVLSRGSQENRYRAVAIDDPTRRFMLRERVAPVSQPVEEAELEPEPVPAAQTEEDPSGPKAKTRELPPLPQAPSTQASAEQAEGGLQEVKAESERAEASEPAETTNHEAPPEAAAVNGAVSEATSPEPETPKQAANEQDSDAESNGESTEPVAEPAPPRADLGEVFERVMALSRIITHPAYYRALEGFAEDGRVYLVYPGEELRPFSLRSSAMAEHEALSAAIQICQAVSYLHHRGMRVNDICPASLAYGADGRIKLTSLDYVSNDTELQTEPILNDGYTAPEIYRAKQVDKRADVFSIGCVLYTCLTGQRIECETWREEASPIRFYPPHVISPDLEKMVRRALAFRSAERWAGTDQLKAELLRLNSRLRIRSACLTDVGVVREHNEDSVMAVELVQDSQVSPACNYLYVVSDGMGGAEAGETASAIAVETIRYYVERGVTHASVSASAQKESAADQPINGSREQLLQSALEQAHRDIIGYQTDHPESRGMGATAVSALIAPPDAVIAWVGDSRAYLMEGGKLRQLTKDHSLVQRLVDIGQITPEQARHHEHKNVITRSLGARANAPAGAEAMTLRLKRGDRLLLCSDGLMAHVEDSAIAEILARRRDPMEASRELVVAANAGGGSDNISVIVIDAE
jgi:serine/threonine protein phosphatase PrpC